MKRLFIIMLLLASAVACSDEKKPPNEDALLAVEAFGIAEGLKESYQKGDFGGMRRFCTEDAFNEIIRDVKKFNSVSLEFTPSWVEIKEDGTVFLNVRWQGSWSTEAGVKEERGMVVFKLADRPLRLVQVLRSSPFSQPQPAEAPPRTLFE